MGKGDHRKTLELDPRRLAELKSRTTDDKSATPQVTVGRAKTLDDPLTTGLLAEVARRTQTSEFDPETIEALLESESVEIIDRPATAHPNVRKKSG